MGFQKKIFQRDRDCSILQRESKETVSGNDHKPDPAEEKDYRFVCRDGSLHVRLNLEKLLRGLGTWVIFTQYGPNRRLETIKPPLFYFPGCICYMEGVWSNPYPYRDRTR